MERVRFIEIEDEEPDLILSFALDDPGLGIKSLILLRTPEFEILLPKGERGVHVTLEGDEDLEKNILESIAINKGTVSISTMQRTYNLNIESVEQAQLNAMLKFINKLNFDSSFLVRNA